MTPPTLVLVNLYTDDRVAFWAFGEHFALPLDIARKFVGLLFDEGYDVQATGAPAGRERLKPWTRESFRGGGTRRNEAKVHILAWREHDRRASAGTVDLGLHPTGA